MHRTLPTPSGAKKESFPRGAPMQHLAPRRNPECSNGHFDTLDGSLFHFREYWRVDTRTKPTRTHSHTANTHTQHTHACMHACMHANTPGYTHTQVHTTAGSTHRASTSTCIRHIAIRRTANPVAPPLRSHSHSSALIHSHSSALIHPGWVWFAGSAASGAQDSLRGLQAAAPGVWVSVSHPDTCFLYAPPCVLLHLPPPGFGDSRLDTCCYVPQRRSHHIMTPRTHFPT